MPTTNEILEHLAAINAKLNEIANNAKTTEEFNEQTDVNPLSWLRVYDGTDSKKLRIQKILDYFESLGYVTLSEIYQHNEILASTYQWIENYKYEVVWVKWVNDGEFKEFTFNEEVILSAADPTDDRRDIIALNIETETIEVVEGTPASNPSLPTLNENQKQITEVIVEANTTEPSVTETKVYEENAQVVGGEFNTSTNAATRITLEDTSNPDEGTKAIKFDTSDKNDRIDLDNDSLLSGGNFSNLVFRIKLDNAVNHNLQIAFRTITPSSTSSTYNIYNGRFGFDATNQSGYQTISIPVSVFNIGNYDFNRIRIVNKRDGASFIIDNIKLQSGNNPSPELDFLPTGGYQGSAQDIVDLIASSGGGSTASDALTFSEAIVFTGKFQHSVIKTFTPNAEINFTKGVFTTDETTIGGVYQVKLNCDNNTLNFNNTDFYIYGVDYIGVTGVFDFKFILDGDGLIGVIGLSIGSEQLITPLITTTTTTSSTTQEVEFNDLNTDPTAETLTIQLDTANTFDTVNLVTATGVLTSATVYEFTGLDTVNNTYYIRIKAVGDTINTLDSPYSVAAESLAVAAWYGLVNATDNSTTIEKSGGVDGDFDASAFANGNLNVDGDYIQITMPSGIDASEKRFACGVTSDDPSPNYLEIDHALAFNTTYTTFENSTPGISYQSYSPGDTFRWELANSETEVLLKQNGTTVYTYPTAPTLPLKFYISLRDDNTELTEVTINN
ncbi:MAG: hypothetical protein ACPGRW_06125 [Flavobacteriaceae bacterium]